MAKKVVVPVKGGKGEKGSMDKKMDKMPMKGGKKSC